MAAPLGVIKKDAVKLSGAARIGPAGPQAPTGPAARILQQADGLALVEVTCVCGRKIQLHCRYQQPAEQT